MQEKGTKNVIDKKLTAQKTILLVDDDEDEHEIFLSALKSTDKAFHFIGAKSCEQALTILKKLDPDYIFIDVNMPRTDGMTCLQEIKKMTRVAKVPVYMYSTGINAKEGQKALQLGAVDYLIKTNSLSALSTLLETIIN